MATLLLISAFPAAAAPGPADRYQTASGVEVSPLLDRNGPPDKKPEWQLRAIPALSSALADKKPSVSQGNASDGSLENPAAMPVEGYGYRFAWPERDRRYGTDSLIAGLIWSAAMLRSQPNPGFPLGIGDISARAGGKLSSGSFTGKGSAHASHQSGRDVDLLFFLADAEGSPLPAVDFVDIDAVGTGMIGSREVHFDSRRNWRLVKALLTNPYFGKNIDKILISAPLEELILAAAREAGEKKTLLSSAAEAMRQPSAGEAAHDDHYHMRIVKPSSGLQCTVDPPGCR